MSDVVTAPASPATARDVTVRGLTPADGQRSFRGLFRPHAGRMGLGVFALVVTNAFALVMPRLVNQGIDVVEGRTVDSFVLGLVGFSHPTVAAVGVAIIVVAIFGGIARTLSRVLLFNVGRDVEHDMRRDLFAHMSTLSPTYYGQNPTGDLMSRLTNDLTNVRLMAGFALLNTINATIVFTGTLPLLFSLDWKVALFALGPFPLVMGLAQLLARTMYARTRKNQEMLGALTSHVQENLAGQTVVRAFSQQEAEQDRFAQTNERAFDAAMKLALIRVVMFPMMGLMAALGVGIALYVGGNAVLAGRMTVGDIVEFNARLLQLMWPAIAFGFIVSVYQRGRAGLDRINEVLAARPDIVDGHVDRPLAGALEATGLSARYPSAKHDALDGVSFSVDAGGVLGVVGKSGGGKSSLVRALSRMLVVEPGQIAVDGVDINEWNLTALARGIAVVPDDGFLFSATLRDNLAFARPDASDEEVAAAVKLADLERDIEAFPEGLLTPVGERGVTLSGGQRQRVALARALLARPRVLLLDDCLSAVDAETESRIVATLREGAGLLGGGDGQPVTLVIVSHRLSAVKGADEILVLEDGRVLERGTHDALLEEDGRYADLWGREQLQRALEGDG